MVNKILQLQQRLKKRDRGGDTSFTDGTGSKMPKVVSTFCGIVVKTWVYDNGNKRSVAFLVTSGPESHAIGSKIEASFNRNMKQEDFIDLLPGTFIETEIAIKQGTKKRFYDINQFKNRGFVSSKEYAPMLSTFRLPTQGAKMPQWDLLVPCTQAFTDIENMDEEATNGLNVVMPEKTFADEKYDFKRILKLGMTQWTDSSVLNGQVFHMLARIKHQALFAFGVTNIDHWKNDTYADKWLLGSEYVVRCSFSKKMHDDITKQEQTPEDLYTTGSHILINLPEQVRKIGEKCDPSTTEAIMKCISSVSDIERARLANENPYTNLASPPILNVGESQHEVDHDLYDYYLVGDALEVFDLFAIRK